ncbi:MAG: CapA family protein [Chloroflexi bacterium]|nr:CapA family protein [Chloroflexota bacterium]
MAVENKTITLMAVGDVGPNRDDPPSIFRHCRDVLGTADIVFGQMEAPLSDRGTPMFCPSWPRKLPAKNAQALTELGAGFDVMSFAGNHAMDYGWEAFYDSLDDLKANNIAVIGAGRNIAQARTPAVLERHGTKVGFLGYLSIVHPGLIALEDVPGCAPLRATSAYQQMHYSPGSPPLIVTRLFPDDKRAMEEDIAKLRARADVVVISMHCGVLSVPAMIAMYQKEAAYAAIDAGADIVLQHHAHMLRGIEIYKGKAIFYGLGNFALEHGKPFPGMVKAWASDQTPEMYRATIARIRPVRGLEKHRYNPEALRTMIAKVTIEGKAIRRVSYLPAYINPDLEPEVVARKDKRAREVFNYVQQISEHEDLAVSFSWKGGEVSVDPVKTKP